MHVRSIEMHGRSQSTFSYVKRERVLFRKTCFSQLSTRFHLFSFHRRPGGTRRFPRVVVARLRGPPGGGRDGFDGDSLESHGLALAACLARTQGDRTRRGFGFFEEREDPPVDRVVVLYIIYIDCCYICIYCLYVVLL